MIKSINSNGRYITVSGGSPSSTYYQNGMPMAGMTRYYNNNLEVYDGSGWVQIGNSYATVGLTSEAEEILDWAREKRREEEAMLPLPSDHPAVKIAKENGCDFVINYSKESFSQKVKEITNGKMLDVVYDGVGAKTFEESIECLAIRGTMVSFGNASGLVEKVDPKKHIAPKGLFFTRPSIAHYTVTRDELVNSANTVFEAIRTNKFKVKIFKKFALKDAVTAHEELEARKLTGPAILVP